MSQEFTQAINLTLKVKLNSGLIENHSSASPYIVGEELASNIATYVHDLHMGYYPALEYFHDMEIIDAELFSALENISELVTTMSKELIHKGLCKYMQNIKFDSVHMIATTIPQVRPGTKNAMHELALHYTPDQCRVSLYADLIQLKQEKSKHILSELKNSIDEWLQEQFVQSEVSDIWYRNDESPKNRK